MSFKLTFIRSSCASKHNPMCEKRQDVKVICKKANAHTENATFFIAQYHDAHTSILQGAT